MEKVGATLFLMGIFGLAWSSTGWCQAQEAQRSGETLKHSQDTMEYYRLQQKLNKNSKRLQNDDSDKVEKDGNPKEIEIEEDEDNVIRYFNEGPTENQK